MTRPTIFGRSRPILIGDLGSDPEVPIGDVPEPVEDIDRAAEDEGGTAYIPVLPGLTPGLIQWTITHTSGFDSSISLDNVPSPGNLIVVAYWGRNEQPATPTGFDLDEEYEETGPLAPFMRLASRVSQIGDDGTYVIGSSSFQRAYVLMEWSGIDPPDATLAEDKDGQTTQSIDPAGSDLTIALFANAADLPGRQVDVVSPSTLIVSDGVGGGPGGPWGSVGYDTDEVHALADADSASFHHMGAVAGNYPSSGITGVIYLPDPRMNDGDDSTCALITDPEDLTGGDFAVAKISIEGDIIINRARVLLGTTSAGSYTYELRGADSADFLDEEVVDSVTDAFAGGYATEELLYSWTPTSGHPYWRLVGPDVDVSICSFELYAMAPITGITDHGGLSGLAEFDHDQYTRAAYGGREVFQAHGNAGSTETVDLANGNYHAATLDADCTFTFTGSVAGRLCAFTLELTEDGSGGWDPTWPGSVVWIGDIPTHDTTAGTTTIYGFFTRDNGTTWLGFQAGDAGSVVAALDDLTDVVITSPTTLDRLHYDGTNWVNTAAIWRPVLDGATGEVLQDSGTGEAVMALS